MSLCTKSCRTCESPEGSLISLFTEFGQKLTFADVLTAFAPVQISRTDKLPKHICVKCSSSLITAYHFQRQCVEIHHKLLNFVLNSNNTNIKLEPKEEESYKEECDDDNLFQDFISDIGISSKLDSKNEIILPEATEVKVDLNGIESDFEKTKIFKCNACSIDFRDNTLLDNHIVIGKCRKHKCGECGKEFSRETSLTIHLKKKHDPNYEKQSKGEALSTYECHMCGTKFKRKGNLINHIVTYSHSHKCKKCGEIFPGLTELKHHMKVHKNDNAISQVKKLHICPYCDKGFKQTSNLREHLNIHTGEKTYLCSECGRAFNCKSNLRQHLMRHSGEKPFACHLCPKKFTLKATLQAHVATHTGERKHTCDACGKSYATCWTLKRHALVHTGATRPCHECDICEKSFTKREHLKRHYRIHTGEKPYVCTICKRAFVQSNDLSKHYAKHLGHSAIYQCDECSERFRLKADLVKHATTHYIEISKVSSVPTDAHSARRMNVTLNPTGNASEAVLHGGVQETCK